MIMIMGAVELVIILAFLAGMWKIYTYDFVMILHGLTTFASWNAYIPPDVSLTFFAAWPMLAACITLFLLRDLDVKFVMVSKKTNSSFISYSIKAAKANQIEALRYE